MWTHCGGGTCAKYICQNAREYVEGISFVHEMCDVMTGCDERRLP